MENQGPKWRLVYGIFGATWTVKLIFGLVDIVKRNVPIYPDAIRGEPYIGQFGFYVAVPLVLVTSNLLMLCFANRLPHWVSGVTVILQIIVLLVLLFLGGGGV